MASAGDTRCDGVIMQSHLLSLTFPEKINLTNVVTRKQRYCVSQSSSTWRSQAALMRVRICTGSTLKPGPMVLDTEMARR